MKRKIPLLFLFIIPLAFCSGCFCFMCLPSIQKTEKTLTTYYTDSPVTAARLYARSGNDDYIFDELPEEQLQQFCRTIDAMELKYHFLHTDYFWGGQYGLELELADGTFLTYDGTKLEHRSASMKEDPGSDADLKGDFLEVTNAGFWEQMQPFFPDTDVSYYSSW